MRATCLVLVAGACNWAVVNVERTSSGAVERDVDFQPSRGSDGHYISLPAYPLVNCVDTLVYDELLTDFLDAAAHADALRDPGELLADGRGSSRTISDNRQRAARERRGDETVKFLTTLTSTTLAKVARASGDHALTSALVELAHQGSDLAKLRSIVHDLPGRTPACIKLMEGDLDRAFDAGLMKREVFTRTDVIPERERLKRAVLAAMERAMAIGAAASPALKKIPLIARLARLRPAGPGCFPLDGDAIDALVEFARGTADDLDQLRKVVPREAFSELELDEMSMRKQRERGSPFDSIASFARLADSFGAAPCGSGPRYRDFLGYTTDGGAEHSASWIDRGPEQQARELQRLESDVGLVPSTGWPQAEFAFLHFSDVQVREPGAKLGGAEVSETLRRLEPSFEQDYDQEQYAMFVYEGIVATANAEWCLYHRHLPACSLAASAVSPDRSTRPAPEMMIHTGDSADMGLQSEFDTFLTYTDKLHVPWYQALGNHDVLAFGNLKLSSRNAPRSAGDECQGWGATPCTCTNLNTLVREEVRRTPDNQGTTQRDLPRPWFTPLPNVLQGICILHPAASDWFVMDPDKQWGGNPVSSFVLSHCGGWHPKPGDGTSVPAACTRTRDQEPVRGDYARTGVPADRCAVLTPGDSGGEQTSVMHGLDLEPGFQLQAQPPSRDLGYYCFQMARAGVANGGRVWGVVLNTNTDAGAFGVLPNEQLTWLRRLLPTKQTCARGTGETPEIEKQRGGALIGCKDLVLLFAHHPIYSLYDQRDRLALTELVTTRPNVVAMFIGHKHRSDLRMIRPLPGSDGQAKWEVMGPAVIDWPQAAREVTLKTHGQLGYFEVLTFSPHGTGASESKIRAAAAGAIRDKCRNDSDLCPGGDGRIHLPNRDLTFPRLFFRLPGN